MSFHQVIRDAVSKLHEGADRAPRPVVDLVMDVAAVVAIADGTVDDAETQALAETLEKLLGSAGEARSAEEIGKALRAIEWDGPPSYAQGLGAELRKLGDVESGLRLGAAVAWASGGLAEDEKAVLRAMAEGGGVAPERLEVLLVEVHGSIHPM
jgi:tellurite resistance protein